jgi:hypothetical protein
MTSDPPKDRLVIEWESGNPIPWITKSLDGSKRSNDSVLKKSQKTCNDFPLAIVNLWAFWFSAESGGGKKRTPK